MRERVLSELASALSPAPTLTKLINALAKIPASHDKQKEHTGINKEREIVSKRQREGFREIDRVRESAIVRNVDCSWLKITSKFNNN